MYRLSMIDLVEEGSIWERSFIWPKEIETAGASIINTELVGMKHEFQPLRQVFREEVFRGSHTN